MSEDLGGAVPYFSMLASVISWKRLFIDHLYILFLEQ